MKQPHTPLPCPPTQAFEIEREGEGAAFRDVGNRMLLWHGSRLANWVGSLSGGLVAWCNHHLATM